ncbi:hypothetical protein ABPG73_003530 [Tetrahymena malaccensis]
MYKSNFLFEFTKGIIKNKFLNDTNTRSDLQEDQAIRLNRSDFNSEKEELIQFQKISGQRDTMVKELQENTPNIQFQNFEQQIHEKYLEDFKEILVRYEQYLLSLIDGQKNQNVSVKMENLELISRILPLNDSQLCVFKQEALQLFSKMKIEIEGALKELIKKTLLKAQDTKTDSQFIDKNKIIDDYQDKLNNLKQIQNEIGQSKKSQLTAFDQKQFKNVSFSDKLNDQNEDQFKNQQMEKKQIPLEIHQKDTEKKLVHQQGKSREVQDDDSKINLRIEKNNKKAKASLVQFNIKEDNQDEEAQIENSQSDQSDSEESDSDVSITSFRRISYVKEQLEKKQFSQKKDSDFQNSFSDTSIKENSKKTQAKRSNPLSSTKIEQSWCSNNRSQGKLQDRKDLRIVSDLKQNQGEQPKFKGNKLSQTTQKHSSIPGQKNADGVIMNMDFCEVKRNPELLKKLNLMGNNIPKTNFFSDEVVKYSSRKSSEKIIIILDSLYFYVFSVDLLANSKQFKIEDISKIQKCTSNSLMCSIQIMNKFQLIVEIPNINTFICYVNNHFQKILFKNSPDIIFQKIEISIINGQKQLNEVKSSNFYPQKGSKQSFNLNELNQTSHQQLEQNQMNYNKQDSHYFEVFIQIQDQDWKEGFLTLEKEKGVRFSGEQICQKFNKLKVKIEEEDNLMSNKSIFKFYDQQNNKYIVRIKLQVQDQEQEEQKQQKKFKIIMKRQFLKIEIRKGDCKILEIEKKIHYCKHNEYEFRSLFRNLLKYDDRKDYNDEDFKIANDIMNQLFIGFGLIEEEFITFENIDCSISTLNSFGKLGTVQEEDFDNFQFQKIEEKNMLFSSKVMKISRQQKFEGNFLCIDQSDFYVIKNLDDLNKNKTFPIQEISKTNLFAEDLSQIQIRNQFSLIIKTSKRQLLVNYIINDIKNLSSSCYLKSDLQSS